MDARDPSLSAGRRPATRLADLAGLVPALGLLGVLFGGALLGAARVSFIPLGGGLGDASLDGWRNLLDDPAFADSVLFTLRITVLSTVLAAVAGVGLALILRRQRGRVRGVAALPVPVPHLLVAVIAVFWLAPGGLADRILGGLPVDLVRDRGGLGVVAVYVYKEAPFIALLSLAAMGASLPAREEAAAVFGAGAVQRLRWVVWPAIRRPVGIGAVIVSAFTVGSLEVPLAIGPNYPPTLAEYAYQATRGDLISGEPRAAAALLVAGAIAVVLAAVGARLARSLEA